MKFSQLFVKSSKSIDKELKSKNARLLIQAGYIHQEIAGVYSYLPLGLRTLNKIENIVRVEMDKIGVEILMPTLSSKQNWEKTGRLESVNILFKASGANKESVRCNSVEYIINSTHEEIITPLVQDHVFSYKHLPVFVYQIQTKFRNEERAKSGLLRCREFRMKDLYSFHTSEKDLLDFYERIKTNYMNIFHEVGIGKDTFITYASGGDFTKEFSHEFQTVLENGEDTIYLDRNKSIAYNQEVVTPENAIKLDVDFNSLEIVKASEVGNIFPLNTKFSDAFNYYFVDNKGSKNPVFMGSYGIGTSRLMGILAEKFADDKGLVWPENVAPYKYHLLTLPGKSTLSRGNEIYKIIAEDCLWDDREDISAGEKLHEADLVGCPYQIVVSERTLANKEIEVHSRNGRFETFLLPINDVSKIDKILKDKI